MYLQVRNSSHHWMALPAKYTFTMLSIYTKIFLFKRSQTSNSKSIHAEETTVLQELCFPNHCNFQRILKSCSQNLVTAEQNLYYRTKLTHIWTVPWYMFKFKVIIFLITSWSFNYTEGIPLKLYFYAVCENLQMVQSSTIVRTNTNVPNVILYNRKWTQNQKTRRT